MNEKNGSITINGTEYIPAKEAEIGFLVALIGIVTGIIFGFFVLKLNYGSTQNIAQTPHSEPIILEQSAPAVPVDGPDAPLFNFGDEESEQGQHDITI